MIQFKKVLCPVDFSEPCMSGLAMADALAAKFKAELVMVHVLEPMNIVPPVSGPGLVDIPILEAELHDQAEKRLSELIERQVSKGVSARFRVADGSPADEIVRIADDEKADLVVMATHGRKGWKHLVFGSVAEKVVRSCRRPVLTVRQPESCTELM